MDAFHPLVDFTPPVSAAATGEDVYARFVRQAGALVLAVVDADQRPVGLVTRNAFLLKMASSFGRDLYAGRPITALMDTDFQTVDHQASLDDLRRVALNAGASELLRGFIVVREGRCLGACTALSLLPAPDLSDPLREAQTTARATSELLAAMSDEIRTPVNGVMAVAELLQRQPLPGHAPAYVQTILESGETLLGILDDAVDLSRADSGALDLAQRPCALHLLMDDVHDLWAARATEDGVSLNVAFRGNPAAAALVDPVRLKQVFGALIGNALKFTRRGGVEASLEATPDPAGLRLLGRVCDTGSGIPADKLDSIFEPFCPQEGGGAGAGLGLALCRQIVGAMGGRVWAEANAGSGATFLFELHAPVAEVQAMPSPDEAPLAAGALQGHVLIVDDNTTSRMVAETLVGLFGCTSESVSDGDEAVEAARTGRFDVMLMDIRMPRMDGMQATRVIRGLASPACTAPIIALTASTDDEDVAAYLACGMVAVVEKPIKAERLFAALASALSGEADDAEAGLRPARALSAA